MQEVFHKRPDCFQIHVYHLITDRVYEQAGGAGGSQPVSVLRGRSSPSAWSAGKQLWSGDPRPRGDAHDWHVDDERHAKQKSPAGYPWPRYASWEASSLAIGFLGAKCFLEGSSG